MVRTKIKPALSLGEDQISTGKFCSLLLDRSSEVSDLRLNRAAGRDSSRLSCGMEIVFTCSVSNLLSCVLKTYCRHI